MKIDISYGNGGRETQELIHDYFLDKIGNPILSKSEDAAIVDAHGKIAFTTDSFVVKPVFFPGGDIGKLAICGTVNDLLMVGATPKFISMGFIIEENFDTDDLEKILSSIKSTAEEAGVIIVTADTKVIDGNGGIYINSSGIGYVTNSVSVQNIKSGDVVIVSGNLGNHHSCILSARMGIENKILSDAAPLNEIVSTLLDNKINIHGMRDVTRGGLATVLNEIASSCGGKIIIDEKKIPVSHEVQGLCSILGLDPLFMGNEGCLVLFVPEDEAKKTLTLIKNAKYGENAAIIGNVDDGTGVVLVKTEFGGLRQLHMLSGEGLPRIC